MTNHKSSLRNIRKLKSDHISFLITMGWNSSSKKLENPQMYENQHTPEQPMCQKSPMKKIRKYLETNMKILYT